jgi:hypothetical protein
MYLLQLHDRMTHLTAVKSTVTVPSTPANPYGTHTLYGCTHIWVRWPALSLTKKIRNGETHPLQQQNKGKSQFHYFYNILIRLHII